MPAISGTALLQCDLRGLPVSIWGATAMADGMYTVGANEGTSAAVYKSTDGLNWTMLPRTPYGGFAKVVCCSGDGQTIYVLCDNAQVSAGDGSSTPLVKSTNGGLNWTTLGNPADGQINWIWCAANGTDVWIVTDAVGIWRSSNGGTSWAHESTTTNQLNGVWGQPDASAIWAVGVAGTILKSNGGGTWSAQTSPVGDTLAQVFGASATEVYARSGTHVIKTTNGGTTWTGITPAGTWQFQGLWAAPGHLYVSGLNSVSGNARGEILHSTNQGGAYATEHSRRGVLEDASSLAVQALWGYTAGTAEVFAFATFDNAVPSAVVELRATTATATWNVWTGSFLLTAAWASGANSAWFGGQFGALYKWDGSTITPIPIVLDDNIRHVTALWGFSPTDLYIADSFKKGDGTFPSRIMHSTDGGLTWTSQRTGNFTVNDIWGPDATRVFACGGNGSTANAPTASSGFVTKSNGGGTWTAVTGAAPGFGNQRWITGSSATDVWTGGSNTDGKGVHGGDPTSGTLPYKSRISSATVSTPGVAPDCGLSLGPGDLLIGARPMGIVRTNNAIDWSLEFTERCLGNEAAFSSLAKVSSTDIWAAIGDFGVFESQRVGGLGVLFHSTGDRSWRRVTAEPLRGRSIRKLFAVDASNVFIAAGGIARTGGVLIFRFASPPVFPALMPGAPTTIQHREWAAANSMATLRQHPGAVTLTAGSNAGKLFVFGGGTIPANTIIATSELFDPATGNWASGPSLPTAITDVGTCVLSDGRILAMGRTTLAGPPFAAALFTQTTNAWAALPTPPASGASFGRISVGHPVPLSGGKALWVGARGSTMILDSSGGGSWRLISEPPDLQDAVAPAQFVGGPHDGKWAFITGFGQLNVFDESTERWSQLAPSEFFSVFDDWSLTALAGGRLLLSSAMLDNSQPTDGQRMSTQLYDSATDTWTTLGSSHRTAMIRPPVVLEGGALLWTYSDADMRVSRIFDPSTLRFTLFSRPTSTVDTAFMQSVFGATFATLSDGSILVVGGEDITAGGARGASRLSITAAPLPSTAWRGRTEMDLARSFFVPEAVVALPGGDAIITGGFSPQNRDPTPYVTQTAERYTALTGRFARVASMRDARAQHCAALLQSGKVFVAGGRSSHGLGTSEATVLSRCEVYDPGLNSWARAAAMGTPRRLARSVVLTTGPNVGKVLVTGGQDASDTPLATCEIYDPSGDTFTATGSLAQARSYHALVTLPDGRVLAIQGASDSDLFIGRTTSEVYDPVAGTWSAGPSFSVERWGPRAVIRQDGTIVVWQGGPPDGSNSFENFEVVAADLSGVSSITGPGYSAFEHAMMLDDQGRVVVSGGYSTLDFFSTLIFRRDVTYLNPDNSITVAPSMIAARAGHVLIPGSVVAVGGVGAAFRETATAEILGADPVPPAPPTPPIIMTDPPGDPIPILRARAIAGQVVRVTFDGEPLHRSPSGISDGLNPANYVFSLLAGAAVAPQAVGVGSALVLGPTVSVGGPIAVVDATNATPIVVTTLTPHGRATGDGATITGALGNTAANGSFTVIVVDSLTLQLAGSTGNGSYTGGGVLLSDERALDVHVDRQLIVGLRYQVRVRNILPAAGWAIPEIQPPAGSDPFTAAFVGVVPLRERSIAAVRASFLDFGNRPEVGHFVVDDSGDIAPEGGIASLKKRILRRLMTPKAAFKWLPNYGLPLRLKETASLAQVASIKQDARQQIALEPEVAKVDVAATLLPIGVFIMQVSARTKTGAVVEAGVQVSPSGGITIL